MARRRDMPSGWPRIEDAGCRGSVTISSNAQQAVFGAPPWAPLSEKVNTEPVMRGLGRRRQGCMRPGLGPRAIPRTVGCGL